MSEADIENQTSLPKPRETFMDLDLDLDGSWPFDQIVSANPTSPFFISSSEQPFSPPWAFSYDNGDELAEDATSTLAGGDPESVTESEARTGNKRRLSTPCLGLTPPIGYPDGSCVIKERMTQALRYFKESTEQHVLAQFWAPVKNGGRYVLTTSGQPFVLGPHGNGLRQYRMASLMYMFSVDGESDGVLGLPGRVFQQKLPEWTPNVQYYSNKEDPRLTHALYCNVQGSLALPVFGPSGQFCIGVLELIMTSPKINYAPEIDKVCKALEAVNLKSSAILDHPNTQICNEGRQKALIEILEILTVVCETHKLPLAQTWVPCRHRSVLANGGGLKKSCSSFDGSCMGQICMSITEVAFYVVDAHMWGFREACAEHHLQKGQGVTGRAFASHNLCFCEDITQFCKTEYPLVHYARMFGLTSSFAICLRSTHTGNDDYILEFFLPHHIRDHRDQRTSLDSILVTMKQHFWSLWVASGKELEEEGRCIEIIKASMDEKLDPGLQYDQISQIVILPPDPEVLPNAPEIVNLESQAQKLSGGCVGGEGGNQNVVSIPEQKDGHSLEEKIPVEIINQVMDEKLDSSEQQLFVEFDDATKSGQKAAMPMSCAAISLSKMKNAMETRERKCGTKRVITLEDLQPHFGLKRADVAKILGVSVATFKRRCRRNGITWWNGNECSPCFKPVPKHCEPPGEKTTPSCKIPSIRGLTGTGNQVLDSSIVDIEGNLQEQNSFQVENASKEVEDALREGDSKSSGAMLPCSDPAPKQSVVTIKATYGEDIVKFDLFSGSGIVELKEEVAKILELERDIINIKYQDEDQDWILIACDADFQCCLKFSSSSGNQLIRLLVFDKVSNSGKSLKSCRQLNRKRS
ncbi:hypothetical protein CEY00_Acc29744 [Actinidia chinensis var. chinensis]|uniref:Uncharacterized protein n=1 Tax=Actinidia chinensis var. chinensis TaxID=1590841 RepID=A0A2R6PDR5_ACTCC|nr:hypothetical protein CEY00_Acc29744 [Actinidia chinensis var. chinensis]